MNKTLRIYSHSIGIIAVLLFICAPGKGQDAEVLPSIDDEKGFFYPADSFNKARFYSALGVGIAGYSVSLYGLNYVWYKDIPRSKFHFYNDYGGWQNMDKYGHAYTSYLYTDLVHDVGLWTGMEDRQALWLAAGVANLFQLTIEIFDGFSEKWGFSFWDIGSNLAGSALYTTQHLLWEEQRIRMKFSAFPQHYSKEIIPSMDNSGTVTYDERSRDLFGQDLASRLLKDYNGQTYWFSINPESFNIPHPKWLNWAIGVGAGNMYAGDGNEWEVEGIIYHPPLHQNKIFYLSPDINWNAFKGQNGLINTLMGLLNYIKAPLPAVSVDTHGNVGWYLVFF